MRSHFLKVASKMPGLLLLAVLSSAHAAVTSSACSVSDRFNEAPLAGGNYIWFNSFFSLPGIDIGQITKPLTITFRGATITFTANGTPYTVRLPDSTITYDPSVTKAITTFDTVNYQWVTTLPTRRHRGEGFLDGVELLVPATGFPGGIRPVTWQGTFGSTSPGLSVKWRWEASEYTNFSADYNSLGVKPVGGDDSDPAGTPENFKSFLIRGGTGEGESDDSDESYSRPVICGTGVPPQISSCRPTSSLTTLVQGSSVTAYVPNGNWASLNTGIQVVYLEPFPAAAPSSIATPSVVNSCSANPVTGQTVCTGNDASVYLISGSTLNTTLTSGATGATGFSGGLCANCGVAINAVSNTAVITIGDSSAPSGSGLQFLNLATNTFSAPVPAVHETSEDILWDPGRNLVLSPDEQGTYDLFDTSQTPPVEYGYSVGGYLDSAAEDCLTGIGVATDEFSSNVFLTDLTQTSYAAGSPAGTWTAPSMLQNIPDFNPYDVSEAGTTGIAVAPGSHLGIVAGEFPEPPSAGNAIIAIQLPSISGSGTPSLVDWAVAVLPNDPAGTPVSMGCDPHTVTAYISPSTGKAIGLISDYGTTLCYGGGTPQYLTLIDLQGLLRAPRTVGTHTVDPIYNLTTSGVVTFVKTQ